MSDLNHFETQSLYRKEAPRTLLTFRSENMANISPLIDSMIKEYLLFRGFTSTFKAFEGEIKADKDKSFRVEKIVDQIESFINTYDLQGLKTYWSHLDRRFFSKLSHEAYRNVCKLETSILRLYVVHAVQNSKQDRVNEFFERSISELQNLPAWKDWFAMPFLKSPEQNPMFSIYFTKVWQESVIIALHNCISTVFSNISLPSILNFDKEIQKIEKMKEENLALRQQIMSLQEELVQLRKEKITGKKNVYVQTKSLPIGEECDYLVVSKKTLQSKEPVSAPPKKPRWKLKANKDNKPKKQQDESLLKLKKKLSFDKREDTDGSQKTSTEPTTPVQSPRVILRSSVALELSQGVDTQSQQKGNDRETAPVSISSSFNPNQTRDVLRQDLLTGSLDYFKDKANKPFIILSQEAYTSHFAPIVNCRFSGDGQLVGSIDTDGVIKLWQCHPTPSTQATIASKMQSLSFDWIPKPNGKLLFGNLTGKIALYDVMTRKTLQEAAVDSKYQRIICLSSSPNGLSFTSSASSGIRKRSDSHAFALKKKNTQLKPLHSMTESNRPSCEGTIFDWDLKTFKMKSELVLDPYPSSIHCMSHNHNGTLLVTGGADGMIRLFDMRTCDCLNGWHAHSTDILNVQFSVDETSIFSLGADGKLCVWDVHRVSSKIAEFELHNSCTGINSEAVNPGTNQHFNYRPGGRLLAFDTDGKYMLTCATNGSVMYSVESKSSLEQVMTIPVQKSVVSALDWNSSPHCSICITGQSDGLIQISSLLRR